ncbi:MAG: YcxB family protein [Porticoccaceae bacterium]|nr:YcxB family protein [Porticoccaceae bacterium]
MQSFNTKFTLSRDYLAECFDQSLPYGKNAKPNYLFPALLFSSGAGFLFFSEQPKVAGSILIALAVLELIHFRFRRAWWLMRQMWGKSANSEVTLSIDEEGIKTQNPYTQTALLWADIKCVIETDLGLILVAKSGGQQYLSKSLFSAELIRVIISRNKD